MSAWKAGKVRYFCNKKGRGVIVCDDGELWEVHYSAIDSENKWKSLKENSHVKFKSHKNEDYRVVKKIKEI